MPSLRPSKGSTRLLHGVCEAARPACYTSLLSGQRGLHVLLVAEPRRAEALVPECTQLAAWLDADAAPEICFFPEAPPPNIDNARRTDRIGERLQALGVLLRPSKHPRLLITTPEALLGPCPRREQFNRARLELHTGEKYDFAQLTNQLARELNYDSEALCENPGQFAIRGGLLDLYPLDALQPYRLDFFGDELESIRTFDPASQRTTGTATSVTVPIATSSDSPKLEQDAALLEYLPDNKLTWILEEPACLTRDHAYRFDPSKAPKGQIRSFPQALEARAKANDTRVAVCEVDSNPALFEDAERTALTVEPTAHYRLDPLQLAGANPATQTLRFEEQLHQWATVEKLACFAVCPGKARAQRLRTALEDDPRTADLKIEILEGALPGGFILRDSGKPWLALKRPAKSKGCVLFTDDEYLGQPAKKGPQRRERARPSLSQVDQMLDFSELADGDPLVHLQHGICLFRGHVTIETPNGPREVLSVEFANAMTLHVTLAESHLLTRYVGLTKAAPKLSKIGGKAWAKSRRAAETATLDYAAQLLNTHAERDQAKGFAFPEDHFWQKEFEAAFPFKETPDQLAAIEATKAEMEQERPMDRLICGDVGFGKTEVAFRAVLKAVLSGKQAAVLVPTTVLCQQHFNTFRERMAPYPISVAQVSRLIPDRQVRERLAELAAGRIDCIIGTHRLLSQDVHFKDLGLLVVDEEQRFGVKHKERLKEFRSAVDILTLSATPIPRTLYLALAGARSMSVIETPPADRRPIETIVQSYHAGIVKDAIQAEVDRGGQVFYLHNRVQTIEAVADTIREMHPKLRVAVGHGQMTPLALEKIMTRFVAGEFDVLVCTTIIESGIDIPNCNTLIIEGADRFGLSQLYQIRGRVGRFKQQAYAYLLLHRHAALVDQAHKRLNALKQHNQLGAGFRIAMRDLELRGAGNLLGSQQSGHIAGVGFELYCQLLKQSVARLKGEPGADRIRAEVQLDFLSEGAELPPTYIAEPRLRIDLYRRLALAPDIDTLSAIADEMRDRFGKLPPPARILLAVSEIRVRAEAAGVRRVETEDDRLKCYRARGGKEPFLKNGSRFPRLTATTTLSRLKEIQTFLKRHARPS
ncbi:MAG: transcription-repair coupling factor [Verrucomicrobia bacterium]|nr:transcription-repair coupling factor [Verrucomicrobiota bacterium]